MRRRQSKEAWEAVLAQLSDYTGTQSEFCAAHGITLTSLRYHLSQRGQRGPVRTLQNEVPGRTFVAVGRVGQGELRDGGGQAVGRSYIDVAVGRISLRVWPDTDLAALRLALQAAVEACGLT